MVLLQVLPEGSPFQHLGSGHSRQAARIGMLAWQEMMEGRGAMSSQLCGDASGIADRIAVVKLPACPEAGTRPATCALLLASRSDDVVRTHSRRRRTVHLSLHEKGHEITKPSPQSSDQRRRPEAMLSAVGALAT